MLVDSHMHTKEFSPDAEMNYHELLDALNTSNFDEDERKTRLVCLTEHYDYDAPEDSFEPLIFDPELYYRTYQERKNSFLKSTTRPYPIHYGVELGYLPHLYDYYDEFVDKYAYDSVISSVHIIDGIDPYFGTEEDLYARPKKDLYSSYLGLIIDMLENFDNFDILGHYDYVARYSKYDEPKMMYDDFPDEFNRIFELLIARDKAMEINTSTANRYKGQGLVDYMPDPRIYEEFLRRGGKYITYGSDAHSQERLFRLYDDSVNLLKSVGLTHLTYYKGRQPLQYEI